MANKLQELTDRLYNEGLSKGKEEGEQLLAKARLESESMVAEAQKKAASIIAAAEKDASALRAKAESDVRMASVQCLQATRKDIENLLTDALAGKTTAEALRDETFIKDIITEVARGFSRDEACDIRLILPESMKDRLEPWITAGLREKLGTGVEAEFSKKVSGGFKIGPASEGWLISFTDSTFNELISEYLRPVTRKLLFGE